MRLRLPAIVVTLAGSFIIGGAALLILPRPGGSHAGWLSDLLAGNTPAAFVILVVVVLLWKLYLATPLGLSLYAAGENPGRRLSLRRAGRRRAHRRLCDQRSAVHRRRPVRRGADRLGRPADRHRPSR